MDGLWGRQSGPRRPVGSAAGETGTYPPGPVDQVVRAVEVPEVEDEEVAFGVVRS